MSFPLSRLFVRKQYEYQKVTKDASETLRSTMNVQEISVFLLEKIVDTVQILNGWLMLYDRRAEEFETVTSHGLPRGAHFGFKFRPYSYLVEYLKNERREFWFDNLHKSAHRRGIDRKDWEKIERLGAKLVFPLMGKNELIGMLFLGEKRTEDTYNQEDMELISTLCNQAAISIESSLLYNELHDNNLNTVRSLATALEAKDEYTRGHSERVAEYAREIAIKMDLPARDTHILHEIGLLHDVGKIGVREAVLNKPGKLTKAEFNHVRQHAILGEKILSSIESLKEGLPIVRHHHEWLNGSGYPDGLSQINMPLSARILAVADAFDAMVTKRPYRPAMTVKEAIQELKKGTCSQFDPHVVRAFIAVLARKTTTSSRRRKSA